jgi:hypothetical protein
MANGWGQGGYGPPPAPGGYGPPPSGQWPHAPQPMIVHHQGQMVGVIRCQACGHQGHHMEFSRITTGGWVVFFALLIMCFPFCWLGLLMREHGKRCGACRTVIGSLG